VPYSLPPYVIQQLPCSLLFFVVTIPTMRSLLLFCLLYYLAYISPLFHVDIHPLKHPRPSFRMAMGLSVFPILLPYKRVSCLYQKLVNLPREVLNIRIVDLSHSFLCLALIKRLFMMWLTIAREVIHAVLYPIILIKQLRYPLPLPFIGNVNISLLAYLYQGLNELRGFIR